MLFEGPGSSPPRTRAWQIISRDGLKHFSAELECKFNFESRLFQPSSSWVEAVIWAHTPMPSPLSCSPVTLSRHCHLLFWAGGSFSFNGITSIPTFCGHCLAYGQSGPLSASKSSLSGCSSHPQAPWDRLWETSLRSCLGQRSEPAASSPLAVSGFGRSHCRWVTC